MRDFHIDYETADQARAARAFERRVAENFNAWQAREANRIRMTGGQTVSDMLAEVSAELKGITDQKREAGRQGMNDRERLVRAMKSLLQTYKLAGWQNFWDAVALGGEDDIEDDCPF